MGIDLSHKLESYSPTSEKKIIQIISKKPFDAHTDPIFKSLHLVCKYWNYLKFTFFKLESLCILLK